MKHLFFILFFVIFNHSLKCQKTIIEFSISNSDPEILSLCDSVYNSEPLITTIDYTKDNENAKLSWKSGYFRIRVNNLPKDKRLRVTNEFPKRKNLVYNKNWYKGYTNEVFFANTLKGDKNKLIIPKYFIEDIDDFPEIVYANTLLFQSNISKEKRRNLDSLDALLQTMVATTQKKFKKNEKNKNIYVLDIREEVTTEKNEVTKVYIRDTFSNQQYELLNLTDWNWNKDTKKNIEKIITQKLNCYLIGWDKPLKNNNTQIKKINDKPAPLRLIWEKPIVSEGNPLTWQKENTLVTTNLTIILQNILVSQQLYGDTKFDIFPDNKDNFKGKIIVLKTKLIYDIKRQEYELSILFDNDKRANFIWKESNIINNNMLENIIAISNFVAEVIKNAIK